MLCLEKEKNEKNATEVKCSGGFLSRNLKELSCYNIRAFTEEHLFFSCCTMRLSVVFYSFCFSPFHIKKLAILFIISVVAAAVIRKVWVFSPFWIHLHFYIKWIVNHKLHLELVICAITLFLKLQFDCELEQHPGKIFGFF